jgi:hypothetical protein
LSNSLDPIEEEAKDERISEVWDMHFDGSFSRSGKGVVIVIESPSG